MVERSRQNHKNGNVTAYCVCVPCNTWARLSRMKALNADKHVSDVIAAHNSQWHPLLEADA